MNAVKITLVCMIGITVALPVVACADLYAQNFTFADGTSVLGDGSDIRSTTVGQGVVLGGQLRMTTERVGNVRSVYRIPALDNSSLGFTASFSFDLIDSGGQHPADGFSFVYGDIPAWSGTALPDQFGYGLAEEGMLANNEISFEVDTWMVGDAEHGFNLGLRVGGVGQPDPFFLNTDVLASGQSVVGGLATASWDPTDGASLVVDLGGGPTPIFTGIATPGFTPNDTFTFAIGARTGGSDETLNLDNVNISTIPEPATIGLGLCGLLSLSILRRFRRG